VGVEYNATPGLQSGKEKLTPVSAKTRAVLTSLTLETALFSDFITLSKLKRGSIAGKSVQSSIAIAFQDFVRVRLYVNLGRMASLVLMCSVTFKTTNPKLG
jgi:hypothetical protein